MIFVAKTVSNGVWLSLVEYVVWDHGAGGSNPSTPILLFCDTVVVLRV